MKRNVDLTENSIFVKPEQFFPVQFTATHSSSSTMTSTETWTNWINSGFMRQGNGRERRFQQMGDEFMAGNTCDRCGRPIFPYNKNTLCPRCSEDLSNEYIDLHMFYKEEK